MNSLNRFVDGIMHRVPPLGYALLAVIGAMMILYMGTRTGADLRLAKPFLANGADKLAHFTAYAAMAACVFRTLYPFNPHRSPFMRHAWLIVLAVPLCIGILDETIQAYTPGRSSDWRDVLADALGGFFVLLLGLWMRRR